MGIYDTYAHVYDRSGQTAFSLRMVPYLVSLLTDHPSPAHSMVDLACGTGTVAVMMAKRGWHVTGIDRSAEMLREARAKAEESSLDICWLQQDMRAFTLPEPVALVTCLYDSMNYMLTDQDLLSTFQSVWRALSPGGTFIFDMNTAYAFALHWDGENYVDDTPGLTVLMHGDYDSAYQRVTARVTWFELHGDAYIKGSEEHTEQAYPPEQVSTYLADEGFIVEGCYECFTQTPPADQSTRILWVARKPLR